MDSNMPSTPKDVKLKLLNDHLHIFPRDIGTYPGSCWNRDTVSQGLYMIHPIPSSPRCMRMPTKLKDTKAYSK